MVGQRPHLAQQHDRLARQRHVVLAAHLGAFGRNAPDCFLEVDLVAPRVPNFAGARTRERHEFHRGANRWPALELVERAQQCTEFLFVSNRSAALNVRAQQRALECDRRIVGGAQGYDGQPEHCAHRRAGAWRFRAGRFFRRASAIPTIRLT